MTWERCSFEEAVLMLLKEFNKAPATKSFALLWRCGDEYSIMDNWWVRKVMNEMDEKTLRVVLWLTREEATQLTVMLARSV